MKKMKRMLSFLAALALCLAPLFGNTMTVRAEGEAVTYYVKYVSDSGEWRYQTGSWDDNGYHKSLYYMQEAIKDGDLLVIDGNTSLNLTVNAHLSNLTIVQGNTVIIHTNGVDNVYNINNSQAVINGDVTNAYVYNSGLCNFNNNVSYLEVINTKGEHLEATIAIAGTLDHVKAYGKSYTHYELYNFPANTFYMASGTLKTDSSNFSSTPSATATATPAPTAAPATTTDTSTTDTSATNTSTTETTTSTNSASSSEYDDVPKTSDIRFNPLWLVGIAAICFVGSYELKKER